jgi:uncharacterized protein (TIGR03083 family)
MAESPGPAASAGATDDVDHVELLAAEGAAFIASMREGEWDAPVPAAPDWNRLALAGHMGKVWSWAHRIVGERIADFPGFDPEPEMTPDTVLGFLETNLVDLIDVLRTCPEDVPLWSMGAEPGVAFWKRRQAQETLMHRYDAQVSVGEVSPINPAAAGDGIAEFVELVAPMMTRRNGEPSGRLTLHANDLNQSWALGEPAGGEATLSGPAQTLLLALWRREPASELTHAGDPDVVSGWLKVPSF